MTENGVGVGVGLRSGSRPGFASEPVSQSTQRLDRYRDWDGGDEGCTLQSRSERAWHVTVAFTDTKPTVNELVPCSRTTCFVLLAACKSKSIRHVVGLRCGVGGGKAMVRVKVRSRVRWEVEWAPVEDRPLTRRQQASRPSSSSRQPPHTYVGCESGLGLFMVRVGDWSRTSAQS